MTITSPRGAPGATGGSDVFAALASPVRRHLLDVLRGGPRPAGELAAEFDMARPSVAEHLRVLREAGLVTQRRSGRSQVYQLSAGPLAEVRDWLGPYERFWRARLRALHQVLDDETNDDQTNDQGDE